MGKNRCVDVKYKVFPSWHKWMSRASVQALECTYWSKAGTTVTNCRFSRPQERFGFGSVPHSLIDFALSHCHSVSAWLHTCMNLYRLLCWLRVGLLISSIMELVSSKVTLFHLSFQHHHQPVRRHYDATSLWWAWISMFWHRSLYQQSSIVDDTSLIASKVCQAQKLCDMDE